MTGARFQKEGRFFFLLLRKKTEAEVNPTSSSKILWDWEEDIFLWKRSYDSEQQPPALLTTVCNNP